MSDEPTRVEAATLLREVQRTTGKTLTLRRMPKPVRISRRQVDCEKAMRMIEAEMLASIQRCADLERDQCTTTTDGKKTTTTRTTMKTAATATAATTKGSS